MTALIAGAGIGGLTLALSLARRGLACQIFEQAPELVATGAGVQLSPNAGHVLDGLGLSAALDAVATRPDGVTISDALTGRTLKAIPFGEAAEGRWGAPYRVIHRSDLQAVLLAAVRAEPSVTLRLNAPVQRAHETVAGPALDLVIDGVEETVTGAWLAGADGLRSVVRTAVKLPPHARDSGLVAWRTVLPSADIPAAFAMERVSVWLAPGAHAVVYPVRSGREANVVLIGPKELASPEAVTNRWALAGRELVAAAGAWTPWLLFDRDPDARMHRGQIALIGDAAHAALPSLAQGAGFAIEDAATLARLVAEGGPDPFGAYGRARLMRCARLQQRSRRQIAIDHMGGLAARARNLALAAAPASALLAGLDWIYGWRDA